jgi:hypothetical protein
VGTAPLRIDLKLGRHQVVALKPGYQVEVRDLWVYPNTERLRWDVELERIH